MDRTDYIYLVPGFLGFANLGRITYFGHVTRILAERLTAPGVGLPTALDVERRAARVRTVVTIATPHHGTPLASFFMTLRGQQLMQLLSLSTIYVLHFEFLPLAALLWMGSLLVRFGGLVANSTLLDELFGRLPRTSRRDAAGPRGGCCAPWSATRR